MANLSKKKIRYPRFIIASVVIIGNLLLGIETFVEFKRMQWKFQQTVEQIKSVEAEILQIQNKSMHMFGELSDELYSFVLWCVPYFVNITLLSDYLRPPHGPLVLYSFFLMLPPRCFIK